MSSDFHKNQKAVWIGTPVWDLVSDRAVKDGCTIREMVERMLCSAIASEAKGGRDEAESTRDR